METIQELQRNSSNIRNICILAHVDHGKTSLADSLVASNGIISQRQAGKLRYMDSREDEQLRGITMKSSAIALQYNQGGEPYLINLIDSPGHVDFSSEVSTAVRLCDGALVVVDAVEGVCPQTQVVLEQAWTEGIKLCLVINKVDRLITELQLTPLEAYYHLQQVLEQVNAVSGSLFSSQVLEAAANKPQTHSVPSPAATSSEEVVYDWSDGLQDIDDSTLYFSPEQGNVIFASALDGWGFSVNDFAVLFASKLGLSEKVLQRTLWGDFYLNSKTKRIFKDAQSKGKKPLFVQFILENLWNVYNAVVIDRNKEKVDKIVSSLKLKISARDSRHTNPRVHLFAICSQWLPLAKTVLGMVVNSLPSPLQLSEERVERLMCSHSQTFDSLPIKTQLFKEKFLSCSTEEGEEDAPVIIYVSKLFVTDKTALPQHQTKPLTEAEIAERREAARLRHQAKRDAEEQEQSASEVGVVTEEADMGVAVPEEEERGSIFLAFSRVFSGVVRRGQRLYVLQPLYDPSDAILDDPLPPHVSQFTVGDMYVLMGRSVVSVEQVPAGNVVGLAGLEDMVIKSATISSTLACPAFGAMNIIAAPIVRVAIEPLHATDLRALVEGMRLLNQADPSVEVSVQETGEHVLAATGEVHLQKCLDDLEREYARIKLKVSAPIIPFRETLVPPPTVDMVNEEISAENVVNKVRPEPNSSRTVSIKECSNWRSECSHSRVIKIEIADMWYVQFILSMCNKGHRYGNDLRLRELLGGVLKKSLLSKEDEGESKPSSEGIVIQTAIKACTLLVEARPLPTECTTLLEKHNKLLKALNLAHSSSSKKEIKLNEDTLSELATLRTKLASALTAADSSWEGAVDQIWSVGPRHTGPNVLLNGIHGYQRPSLWECVQSDDKPALRDYDNSIVSGFQLATLSGPLCEEQMHGVCFILKQWDNVGQQDRPLECAENSEKLKTADIYGPFSGQLISAMKEGCRKAFLAQPARLMAAMYSSNILATANVLGKVYGVLGRRNGRVLSDEMKEGSAMFTIQALIPVAESFGFVEEIRKKTSGLANPQLIFSHWEVIPNDPFWVPSTEEELLHFGEKADSDNIARQYMNAVLKRKGLHVDEKIVQHGEKQRTLKKNK